MGRPRKKVYTLQEKLLLLKKAGLNTSVDKSKESMDADEDRKEDTIEALPDRIRKMLEIIKSSPIKATEMLALVMYDIEDNKVRTLIAKYLIEKGCIRIQKSVYMLRAASKLYREISQTLKDVQETYDNSDSILLVPIPANTPGNMQIIGKDLQIDSLVNDPNVLFF